MKLIIRRIIVIMMVLSTIQQSVAADYDPTSDMNQARHIRIQRMSEAWMNEPVQLRLHSGMILDGIFIGVNDGNFQLREDRRLLRASISETREVVLKRKTQDLIMVGLTSVGVAMLLAAGSSLGSNATTEQMQIIGGIGAGIGFTFGWKAFYQDIVIPLDN